MSTEQQSGVDGKVRRNWPDLSRDQRAWELAKVALGEDADTSELVKLAQEFKQSLLSQTPKMP